LEQSLPAYAGGPVELADARLEVNESPGRISVLVKPGIFTRYVLGPFLFLFCGFWTLIIGSSWIDALKAKYWSGAVLPSAGLLLLGLLTYGTLFLSVTSHEWIIERGRVTRVDYFLGRRGAVKVLEGCLGVVPSAEIGPPPMALRLVHAPDASGKRTTVIEAIAKDRTDLAQWINRVLLGP
jgi:hypothetical protein